MNTKIFRNCSLVFLAIGLAPCSRGQSVSLALNQPAQRDALIESGDAILVEREKVIMSDKNAPDPFVGKIKEVIADTQAPVAPVVKLIINEADLLQNLASRMEARGTAIMGDDKFLLLSQKRLKVGESIIINFDGKDYEVWLVDVTSTTFTIRRNDLPYTRPVLLR